MKQLKYNVCNTRVCTPRVFKLTYLVTIITILLIKNILCQQFGRQSGQQVGQNLDQLQGQQNQLNQRVGQPLDHPKSHHQLDVSRNQQQRSAVQQPAGQVASQCYGNNFSFDCGAGYRIRITRDILGHHTGATSDCSYHRGDCIINNPRATSLVQRYCTGRRRCSFYLVERRDCNGRYTNYQQIEYQCIPGKRTATANQ